MYISGDHMERINKSVTEQYTYILIDTRHGHGRIGLLGYKLVDSVFGTSLLCLGGQGQKQCCMYIWCLKRMFYNCSRGFWAFINRCACMQERTGTSLEDFIESGIHSTLNRFRCVGGKTYGTAFVCFSLIYSRDKVTNAISFFGFN